MKNIKVLDSDFRCLDSIHDCKRGFNPAIYSKKSFKMFLDEESIVEIKLKENLLNFMIDEFGDDIEIVDNNGVSYNSWFVA